MNEQVRPDAQRHVRLWRIGCAVISCLFMVMAVWMGFAIRDAREAARRSQCKGKLKSLALALHNYHDTYGSFPPAYVTDAQGKPMHSWRALILEFVDHGYYFRKYDFTQPWNSPHNLALESQMNEFLSCPSAQVARDGHFADYVVLVGPGTAFPEGGSTRLKQMSDGPENTLLLVEIANSDIRWLEPRDLRIDQMSFQIDDPSRPSISSRHPAGPNLAFADGSVRRAEIPIDPETLRAMTTVSGGDTVDMQKHFFIPN